MDIGFTERHSVARLVGAPPVRGCEDASQLTAISVSLHVVCFEGDREGPSEALNILLQVMEDSHLSD